MFHLTGSRKAVVAGCRVKKGSLARDNLYRVIRNGEVVYEGESLSIFIKGLSAKGPGQEIWRSRNLVVL